MCYLKCGVDQAMNLSELGFPWQQTVAQVSVIGVKVFGHRIQKGSILSHSFQIAVGSCLHFAQLGVKDRLNLHKLWSEHQQIIRQGVIFLDIGQKRFNALLIVNKCCA